MLVTSAAGAFQPVTFPTSKPRLLLISDNEDRLRSFKARFSQNEYVVTAVCSWEEVVAACGAQHDVIAVDVGPEQIAPMLRQIRTSAGKAYVPVLVEATGLKNDHSLAGILPEYRAMPCSYREMLTLMRHDNEAEVYESAPRRML